MKTPSVYLAIFLAIQLTPLVMAQHTYQPVKEGACRGPGGGNDKINSKFVHERDQATCKADCDAEPHCVGYTYHPTANGGECMVHGPGMAGSCSTASATSGGPTACAALGSCQDTTKTSKETCGTCSEASAPSEATCASVKGTWTAKTWTSAGATWEDADDPWTGEWHHSTIIKGVTTPAGGYQCYDIDPTDHQATCTGSDAQCKAAFEGKAESEQVADKCPSGCQFTAAVKAVKVTTPHAPAIEKAGWKVLSGACRGPGNTKVNGKYSNTAGASGGALTQVECAAACEAESQCIGYAHSTAWCVVYGPGIDTTADGDSKWTKDTHTSTSITTATKPNAAYICVVKNSHLGISDTNDIATTSSAKGLCELSAFVHAVLAIAGLASTN